MRDLFVRTFRHEIHETPRAKSLVLRGVRSGPKYVGYELIARAKPLVLKRCSIWSKTDGLRADSKGETFGILRGQVDSETFDSEKCSIWVQKTNGLLASLGFKHFLRLRGAGFPSPNYTKTL